jgi:hypothetical protein
VKHIGITRLLTGMKGNLFLIIAILGGVAVALGRLSWRDFVGSLSVIGSVVAAGTSYEDGQAKRAAPFTELGTTTTVAPAPPTVVVSP